MSQPINMNSLCSQCLNSIYPRPLIWQFSADCVRTRLVAVETTCLYSAASMLLRSASAAAQSLASKPRLAVVDEGVCFAEEDFFGRATEIPFLTFSLSSREVADGERSAGNDGPLPRHPADAAGAHPPPSADPVRHRQRNFLDCKPMPVVA